MELEGHLSICSDAEVVVDHVNGNVRNTVLALCTAPGIFIGPHTDLGYSMEGRGGVK